MDNYQQMKEELDKNKKNLEVAHQKSNELDNKTDEIKTIVDNLKPTLTNKDKYVLKHGSATIN